MDDAAKQHISQLERRIAELERKSNMTDASVQELEDGLKALGDAFTAYGTATNQTIADILAKEAGGGTIQGAELAPIKEGLATLTKAVNDATAIIEGEDPNKAPPQQARSVYKFTAGEEGGTPDPAVWSVAPVVTDEEGGTPTTLYYYSGDVNPGDQNGVGQPGWELYSGPTASASV